MTNINKSFTEKIRNKHIKQHNTFEIEMNVFVCMCVDKVNQRMRIWLEMNLSTIPFYIV